MTPENALPTVSEDLRKEIAAAYGYYSALIAHGARKENLGGIFLFAGELASESNRLLRAANIAGAASLAASVDAVLCRQALREGVVDFFVTSFDEAARILKDELRKKQRVAVAVSLAVSTFAEEMIERGLQPDLFLGNEASAETKKLATRGAQPVHSCSLASGESLYIWPVPEVWSRRIAEFDALVMERLNGLEQEKKRWWRLAPRYLAHEARKLRSLAATRKRPRASKSCCAPRPRETERPAPVCLPILRRRSVPPPRSAPKVL